jgi:hypothetical protein
MAGVKRGHWSLATRLRGYRKPKCRNLSYLKRNCLTWYDIAAKKAWGGI